MDSVLFKFTCVDIEGGQAAITIDAVDWSLSGAVTFACDRDELACLLLTNCRSDSSGFFNLLAGCKPLQVEQWLEYLSEKGKIREVKVTISQPGDDACTPALGLQGEQVEQLLTLIYRIGGFNRLQITRYLKQRSNPALLATRYAKEELERFRLLNDIIRLLNRLKSPR